MRLKEVWISDYKNLKDFRIIFNSEDFLEVMVGKNGSGKSNLFEALIKIFKHIMEDRSTENTIEFDYDLIYQIANQELNIRYKSGFFNVTAKINGSLRISLLNKARIKNLGRSPLPKEVVVYYSGHNPTIAELISNYEQINIKSKTLVALESNQIIAINVKYKELLLATLVFMGTSNEKIKVIFNKLGISKVRLSLAPDIWSEEVLRITLKRPYYALDNKRYSIIQNDSTDEFWKLDGVIKDLLAKMLNCFFISDLVDLPNGYFANDDEYIYYLSFSKLRTEFDRNIFDFFKAINALKKIGMLKSISIPLSLQDGSQSDISYFSDGQLQSIYIAALVEIFKDRDCLMFLDEPDAFLHPEWQFDFLKEIHLPANDGSTKNHIFITTHSAVTLCSLESPTVGFLKRDQNLITYTYESKKDVIHSLSNSIISYSADENKLLIEHIVRNSTKPILFVEGLSDVSILNTAYRKLYPQEEVGILVQDAFNRGFVQQLLARNDLYKRYPTKKFFGLFDFDDGYEDWRKLDGTFEVKDESKGLCKKITDKNGQVKQGYAFLLPLPNSEIKNQVWDENNPIERVKDSCCYYIEHVFHGVDGLEGWFKVDPKTKHIVFKSDQRKVEFAETIVPTLDAIHFEPFRPMFEFIRQKCGIAPAVAVPVNT